MRLLNSLQSRTIKCKEIHHLCLQVFLHMKYLINLKLYKSKDLTQAWILNFFRSGFLMAAQNAQSLLCCNSTYMNHLLNTG